MVQLGNRNAYFDTNPLGGLTHGSGCYIGKYIPMNVYNKK